MNLNYTLFMGLYSMISRLRADKAIDEFFTPYIAAKYGKECSDSLFKTRGSIFKEPEPQDLNYTEEQVQNARKILENIIRKREKEAAKILSES